MPPLRPLIGQPRSHVHGAALKSSLCGPGREDTGPDAPFLGSPTGRPGPQVHRTLVWAIGCVTNKSSREIKFVSVVSSRDEGRVKKQRTTCCETLIQRRPCSAKNWDV